MASVQTNEMTQEVSECQQVSGGYSGDYSDGHSGDYSDGHPDGHPEAHPEDNFDDAYEAPEFEDDFDADFEGTLEYEYDDEDEEDDDEDLSILGDLGGVHVADIGNLEGLRDLQAAQASGITLPNGAVLPNPYYTEPSEKPKGVPLCKTCGTPSTGRCYFDSQGEYQDDEDQEESEEYKEFMQMENQDPLVFLRSKMSDKDIPWRPEAPVTHKDLLGRTNLRGILKTNPKDKSFTQGATGVWDVPIHEYTTDKYKFLPEDAWLREELILPASFAIESYDPETSHVPMTMAQAESCVRSTLGLVKESPFCPSTNVTARLSESAGKDLHQAMVLLIGCRSPLINMPHLLDLVRLIPCDPGYWSFFMKNMTEYIRTTKGSVGFYHPSHPAPSTKGEMEILAAMTLDGSKAGVLKKFIKEKSLGPCLEGLGSLYRANRRVYMF